MVELFNGRPRCQTYAQVGDASPDMVGLYVVHNPSMTSFAAMTFRPQLMVEGALCYTHNPYMSEHGVRNEETEKPQVMGMHAWGAQTETGGGWDYLIDPDKSRARGGVVHGGVLLTPPEFEMENYYSIGTDEGPYGAQSISYLCCAPGTAFACGTPRDNGGLEAQSVIICQLAIAGTNDPFQVLQLNSSRVTKVLFQGELDQGSGEIVVDVGTGGTGAVTIPQGTIAQRPSALGPAAGQMRVASNSISSTDIVEYYESQNGEWAQVGGNSVVASSAPTTWAGRLWLDTTCTSVASEGTFLGLTDTESNYTGDAGKVLRVNAAEDAIEHSNTWPDNIAIALGTGADSTIVYDGSNTFWNPKAVGSGSLVIQGTLAVTDNNPMVFGTGGDSTIVYDGSNTFWNPKAVGSGSLIIQGTLAVTDGNPMAFGTGGDSTITYDGTDTLWNPKAAGSGVVIMQGDMVFNDSTLLTFGTGKDSTISFDGTNTIWNLQAVGFGSLDLTGDVKITQGITSAGVPVLNLEQLDINDTFVNYIGTSAADGSRSISSDISEDAAKAGAFRVEINGAIRWIRFYDNHS